MEYVVRRYEVWIQEYEVEATSPEQALSLVVDQGEGTALEFEFSRLLDSDEVIDEEGIRVI